VAPPSSPAISVTTRAVVELARTLSWKKHMHEHQQPYSSQSSPLQSPGGKLQADAFVAYADGSSLHNPGPAGWAVLIVHPDGTEQMRVGSEPHATNNQMELRAAIEALQALPHGASGVIHCDSEYVVRGVTEWRLAWERRGWRNSKGQPVANADLWRALHRLSDERPGVRFAWVRGHAGDHANEFVNMLARDQAFKATEQGGRSYETYFVPVEVGDA